VSFPECVEDIQMIISDDPCSVEHFKSGSTTVATQTFGARLIPVVSGGEEAVGINRANIAVVGRRAWALLCLPQAEEIHKEDQLRVTWGLMVRTFEVVDCAIMPIHWEVSLRAHD
jgi:hypothetical protein